MPFRRPKQVDYRLSEEGTVGVSQMAQILGITRQHLSDLARAGRVPTTIVRGVRRYDVDQILALASQCHLPFPPLRQKKRDPLAESLWAWDALANGPANCETAPNGRAWALYLSGKTDPIVHRRLSRLHLAQASHALDRDPGYGLEDAESSALAAGSGQVDDGEYAVPEPPPSIFGPIDEAKVANSPLGSFEPDPQAVSGETDY